MIIAKDTRAYPTSPRKQPQTTPRPEIRRATEFSEDQESSRAAQYLGNLSCPEAPSCTPIYALTRPKK
jgi:hypothetical protein